MKRDFRSAQEICEKSIERWDKIKKRGELETSREETPRKRPNNGFDTVNYLKSKSELEIRKSKLKLKRQELQLQLGVEEKNDRGNEQLLIQNQQQNQALLKFLDKVALL